MPDPNPFTATFGVSPPVLVGRDQIIADFRRALDRGPGASGRAALYTGARGSGKTVLLNAVEDVAREQGWIVISETASPGFAARITLDQLPSLLRDFDPKAVSRHLRGLTAPLNAGAVQWDTIERHVVQSGMRSQLALLTDLLAEHETGVLITLDEVHRHQIDELRELITTVQHAFRENRQVAFVAAGLASSVSDLLNDTVLTFLRRASRYTLGPVSDTDVERGFREPIEQGGRQVGRAALDLMVDATRGYPFMIQLVGEEAWDANPDRIEISPADARHGVDRARRRIGSLVYEPALAAATPAGRAFLLAMADDDGPSSIADIRGRLGVTSSYAGQYRRRLMDAELIQPAGHGFVDFALPYLREYLREQDDGGHPPRAN